MQYGDAFRVAVLGDKDGELRMSEMLGRVCFLSVAFGIVSTLTDDEGVSHIIEILCTCILLICVLEPIKKIDFESFSLDMAMYREKEDEILRDGEEMNAVMTQEVIENEYASYIKEKAEETDVRVGEVRVKTKWDTEGIWVPHEAYIEFESDGRNVNELRKTVEFQLGIPEERQTWIHSGK